MSLQNCVPLIVATHNFSSITTDISATTVYTPSADGIFRVSIYGENTNASGVGANIHVTSTGAHSNSLDSAMVRVSGVGYITSPIVIKCIASSNIQVYSTGITGSGTTNDFFVTVEQLQ